MVRAGTVVRRADEPAPLPRHNLPVELTSFVGRERELAEVAAELERTRLLSLTGPGGSGKTRLALALAAGAADAYPDGVWWLELATIADGELVGAALARALGVRPLPGLTDPQAAVAFLATRRALVVVDNCEHVLSAVAETAEELLRGCPAVTVLVTSRECLRVEAETEWRVPPLSTQGQGTRRGADGCSDAERLFVERAAKVSPGFERTADNAPTLARICRELDGMPLAIELAAARLRMMSLQQIAEGLADGLRLLTGGARGALPRQQTLRGSIDWSYGLLTVRERTLFRRLAVFSGGFGLEAVEEVCCDEDLPQAEVLDLLASLVDKSLVQVGQWHGAARYRLLEIVRQYALERLEQAGEVQRLLARHRDAFLALAERLGPAFEAAPLSLERLDADAANLTQAIDYAADSDADKALRICAASAAWWHSRGLFAAGESAYGRALAAAGDEPTPLHARVLAARAYLRLFAGDNEQATAHAQQALAEAEQLGDPVALTMALGVVAGARMQSDPIGSRPLMERCLELARTHASGYVRVAMGHTLAASYLWADDHERALAILDELLPDVEAGHAHERRGHHWFCYGWVAYARGGPSEARELFGRAGEETSEPNWKGLARAYALQLEADAGRAADVLEPLLRLRDDLLAKGALMTLPWVEAAAIRVMAAAGELVAVRDRADLVLPLLADRALHPAMLIDLTRAEALRLLGQAEEAHAAAERAMEAAERLQNARLVASARGVLGRLAATRGEWDEAERLHHRGLSAVVDGGYRPDLPIALESLAEVAAGLESNVEAARLLGTAARARREIGVAPWADQAREIEALRSRMLEALGGQAFEAAFEEGEALTPEEAVAWTRRARGSRKRPLRGWESLTPTEVDVVRRAAAGLTNREIGERMFISPGTVKVHLSHAYAKLDVRNRAELTRVAARRLTPDG